MDRSNTLMTPQELERMPDQGLEFEQSVGPKEMPKVLPVVSVIKDTGESEDDTSTATSCNTTLIPKSPIILSHDGDQLTTITVLTSQGEKVCVPLAALPLFL